MELTYEERQMLDGAHGEAKRVAMDGLVQLGEAFGAEDMVEIGYAHIHAGMAMYLHDVEMMEELADMGATMAVPSSSNISNADMENWRQIDTPEALARLQQRAAVAHGRLGSTCAFTCTPYLAGHWPTWNMHMVSIESTVTVFCNSVLGAKSNRDGFFAVYAAMTGRYPRFGYHLDENRRGTHRVRVETALETTTDYSCLGFHVGRLVGNKVPVLDGLTRRPTLAQLDALGAAMATSGGVALFIIPGLTPPFDSVESAFRGRAPEEDFTVHAGDVAAIYDDLTQDPQAPFDIVHLGCPHASFDMIRDYVKLLDGRRVHAGIELWVTASRAVRRMAVDAGLVQAIEKSGGKVISDTCPMSTHLACTTSPDPALGLSIPKVRGMVFDSCKQAKYCRDVIQCPILLTDTASAIDSAITGRFHRRHGGQP